MSGSRLPWSWLALFGAALVVGFVMVFGMFFIQEFRRGLDADMGWVFEKATAFDMLQLAGAIAVMGAPFLVAARWIANRLKRPGLLFPWLAAAGPILLMAALRFSDLVSSTFEEPMNVPPFEQDNLFYLPNWLELGSVLLAFTSAAVTYASLSRHFAIPRPHE